MRVECPRLLGGRFSVLSCNIEETPSVYVELKKTNGDGCNKKYQRDN